MYFLMYSFRSLAALTTMSQFQAKGRKMCIRRQDAEVKTLQIYDKISEQEVGVTKINK